MTFSGGEMENGAAMLSKFIDAAYYLAHILAL